MTYFGTFGPAFASLARAKLDTSNFVHLFIMASSNSPMTCCPQMGRGPCHMTTSSFGKKVAISQKRYKIATWLQWATNRRLVCVLSNDDIDDDLEWPIIPKMTNFGTHGRLLALGKARHFKFRTHVDDGRSSQQMTCNPQTGRDEGYMTSVIFGKQVLKTVQHSYTITMQDR